MVQFFSPSCKLPVPIDLPSMHALHAQDTLRAALEGSAAGPPPDPWASLWVTVEPLALPPRRLGSLQRARRCCPHGPCMALAGTGPAALAAGIAWQRRRTPTPRRCGRTRLRSTASAAAECVLFGTKSMRRGRHCGQTGADRRPLGPLGSRRMEEGFCRCGIGAAELRRISAGATRGLVPGGGDYAAAAATGVGGVL